LPLNFGTDGVPPASLAMLVDGAPVRDWAVLTGRQADPTAKAMLLALRADEVLPRFLGWHG
jgi:hypothetical protein